jgi:hypothetical protein
MKSLVILSLSFILVFNVQSKAQAECVSLLDTLIPDLKQIIFDEVGYGVFPLRTLNKNTRRFIDAKIPYL